MVIDLLDKKWIADLLTNGNLVKKAIRNKTRVKFEHIESRIGKSEIGNKKITFLRKGFKIEQEEGNPEFIKNMTIFLKGGINTIWNLVR